MRHPGQYASPQFRVQYLSEPKMCTCSVTPGGISPQPPLVVCRAGMIIDAQLKQLRLLRGVLTGRNSNAEGQSRQGSTMRNLSMLRGSLRPQASSLSVPQL